MSEIRPETSAQNAIVNAVVNWLTQQFYFKKEYDQFLEEDKQEILKKLNTIVSKIILGPGIRKEEMPRKIAEQCMACLDDINGLRQGYFDRLKQEEIVDESRKGDPSFVPPENLQWGVVRRQLEEVIMPLVK